MKFIDEVATKFSVAPGGLIEAVLVEHFDKKISPNSKKKKIQVDIPANITDKLRKIAKTLNISLNSLIVGVSLFEARRVVHQAELKKQYAAFEKKMFKAQCKAMEKEMAAEDKLKKRIKSK